MSATVLPETGVGERLPFGLDRQLGQFDGLGAAPEVEVEVTEDEPEPKKPGFLRGEFDANLAEELEDNALSTLANDLLEGIEADIASRVDWEATLSQVIDLLGLRLETPSGEVNAQGSVSKVHHTLLLEACIRFWATAHAEHLPAAGPVKVRDDNPQPDENGLTLGRAFELDMNHWLTTTDRGYYRDKSRMLFSTGLTGTEFRKVFRDPIRNRPTSRWVRGQNLIVSSDAVDLSSAARVTERIMMSPADVKRLQKSGWWRDVDLSQPVEQPTETAKKIGETEGRKVEPQLPKDNRHEIYECYAELDLPGFEHEDEDGATAIPLPYRVSIDKDSRQIVEVRRNWKEDDPEFCARQRYVMFGLVPGLGFYYIGFAHMGGNNERALTALLRELLDAGQFANFPGLLIDKSVARQQGNVIRVAPGAAQQIDTGSRKISDVVMPLPYKEPSLVLMQLGEKIAENAQKLMGTAQIPVGEGRQDIPVGTMIAMVEQATKVVAAVSKGLHASDAEEFRLLQELFAEDPAVLTRGNRSPAREWLAAEEFANLDLVPASDPNVPSQLVRIMHSVALVQLSQAFPGQLDPQWVITTVLRTLGAPDPKFAPPQPQPGAPPPDPNQSAALALKGQEQQRKAASEQVELQIRQIEAGLRAQQDAADRESKERIEGARQATERLRLHFDAQKAEADRQAAAHQAAMQAVSVQARNQGSGGITSRVI